MAFLCFLLFFPCVQQTTTTTQPIPIRFSFRLLRFPSCTHLLLLICFFHGIAWSCHAVVRSFQFVFMLFIECVTRCHTATRSTSCAAAPLSNARVVSRTASYMESGRAGVSRKGVTYIANGTLELEIDIYIYTFSRY
uniref:Putative secreted protein n=1 Tax=Anopheles darlingi TaxID=43151 RepID=A0A2M4D8Y2_ANODA